MKTDSSDKTMEEVLPEHDDTLFTLEGPPPVGAEISRRQFMNKAIIGVAALIGGLTTVPLLAYVIAPLFKEVPDVWRVVGPVGQFKIGETVQIAFQDATTLAWAGTAAQTSAFLRKESDTSFTAFTVACSHLGCPVRWEEGARLFMCPCHGGVYYNDGRVAAGPPPYGLARFTLRINNGNVELLASKKPTPPPADATPEPPIEATTTA